MYNIPKYYHIHRPTTFSFINTQIENHVEVVQKFINNMATNVVHIKLYRPTCDVVGLSIIMRRTLQSATTDIQIPISNQMEFHLPTVVSNFLTCRGLL